MEQAVYCRNELVLIGGRKGKNLKGLFQSKYAVLFLAEINFVK